MATTITAGNATNGGAAVSSDNTGILELKTGTGAGTTAVTIGTNQAVTFAGAVTSSGNQTVTGNLTVNGNTTLGDANTDTILMTAAPSIGGAGLGMGFGFRNRIINGAMVIDQRNAGASVTVNSTTSAFPVDRFFATGQSADGVFTVQRSSVAPTGFTNSILATVTTADASIGASQRYFISQGVEGVNWADMMYGSASAQTATLSFWVRSSLTGTFGGSIRNNATNRSYPFSYTISAANTWEQKTITFTGDTTGTWVSDTSGAGVYVSWSLGAGSSFQGTANAWNANNNISVTGETALIGTNGATFYITGVQLEKGSTATSFDYRPYGTELQLCQRYFIQYGDNTTLKPISFGSASSTVSVDTLLSLPVEMRAVPTISASANLQASDWNNALTLTSPTIGGSTSKTLYLYGTVTGATQYRPYMIRTGSSNGYIHFSSEL